MQSCLFIRANRASIVPSVMRENTGGQIERVQRRGGSEKRASGRGGGGGVDNGRPVCDHGRLWKDATGRRGRRDDDDRGRVRGTGSRERRRAGLLVLSENSDAGQGYSTYDDECCVCVWHIGRLRGRHVVRRRAREGQNEKRTGIMEYGIMEAGETGWVSIRRYGTSIRYIILERQSCVVWLCGDDCI